MRTLRALGAAREAAYFATAPFVGAILAMLIFRELPTKQAFGGATLMIAGVAVLLREHHAHRHLHEALFHEHLHVHDEHHQHHHDGPISEPHSHPHQHSRLSHENAHVSDIHHRHAH